MKTLEKRDREGILHEVGGILSTFQEIKGGYVFGSFLEGNFRDIDVALLLRETFSPYEAMKFAMRVGRELERKIKPRYEFDVRVLNSAPTHFQYEVIKKGKPVFTQNEKTRIRYEAELLSRYLDYRETLNWFNEKMLARA